MPDKSEHDALVDALTERYRKQLKEQLPSGDLTLDQIEKIAGQIGNEVSQEVQKRLSQQQTRKPRPKQQKCSCGQIARYKGEQARTLVTVHGTLQLLRACYYCSTCQKMLAPCDGMLGLDGGCTTQQVRLWAGWLCALHPFAEAATTLEMLTGVSLSPATLERLSLAMGQSLAQEQKRQAQDHRNERLSEPAIKPIRRLYVGMDGLFVPLRDPWQRDGSQGELHCRFGECKIGVVYQTFQDEQGKDGRVQQSDYVATFAGVEVLEPILGSLAHQKGHHQAKEVVVLGDGASWIWQIAAKQFPGAVQIVDFYHCCDHLSAYAEARFGKGNADGQVWQKARQTELKSGQLVQVLQQIKQWRPSNEAKRKIRRDTFLYFYNNAHRMRYHLFLEKGYHIGSGVVEASCKHVIGQRLDQAGMHWRQESAEAIATLRAAQLSSHPPDMTRHCAWPN